MRIISDFHDYYDAVQATGQDQTLVYYRKQEEVAFPNYPFPVLASLSVSPYYRGRYPLRMQQHIVGFCGKTYPLLVLSRGSSGQTAICYELQDVDCFVQHHFRRKEIEEYRTRAKHRWHWRYWPGDIRRDSFEKYFVECAAKKDRFAEIFLEKRCPVFVGTAEEWDMWGRNMGRGRGKIIYNACLKDLEFFRLFDTYTAFQEIAMFLGGLAVPLKEIPHVPDRIMVGAKGFDQWSFRKPPQNE